MGMFGQGLGRLAATAFLGTNEMSRRDELKRQRAMQDAVMAANREAGGLMSPVPGAMRQMQIGNVEGADITDAFGPAMEQGPSRQRSPQEIAAALADLQGRVPGFNSKPFTDIATFAKPNYQVSNDQMYDPATGQFQRDIPRVEIGQERIYQPGTANTIGTRDLPGAVSSIYNRASATERAKADQELVEVQVNGVPTQMTRGQAAQRMREQQGLPQPSGGMGAGGGQSQGGGFGVGLSPGQQKAQEVDFEGGAKLIGGAQEALGTANSNNRNARMAFDSILQLDPNAATGWKLEASKLMRSLYPQSPELENFVGTAEGFRMLTTRMVLPKAKELGANPSNKDSEIIFKSMPGLTTPRQAGAVYFALEAASSAKEAARQEFFQNWEGEPSQKAIQRAWSQSDGAKRSVFQDETFSRLKINGHPAVVQKTGKDGQRYGIFMPYTANGQPNPSAQVFRIY